MIDILKNIFEANEEKSDIVLKEKCVECRKEVVIKITPTSDGYGLQGGNILKSSARSYSVKCTDCSKSKINDT